VAVVLAAIAIPVALRYGREGSKPVPNVSERVASATNPAAPGSSSAAQGRARPAAPAVAAPTPAGPRQPATTPNTVPQKLAPEQFEKAREYVRSQVPIADRVRGLELTDDQKQALKTFEENWIDEAYSRLSATQAAISACQEAMKQAEAAGDDEHAWELRQKFLALQGQNRNLLGALSDEYRQGAAQVLTAEQLQRALP
jgi:hypothetical protein